jgi:hypothetical protein
MVMYIRLPDIRALLVMLCVSCFVFSIEPQASGQEKDKQKEKNSIRSLFDGIPADLRAKVRDNPVRCDRVNDWLIEHVNGKKTVEIQMGVKRVRPYRAEDGTYRVELTLECPNLNILEDGWRVYLCDRYVEVPNHDFHFTGVVLRTPRSLRARSKSSSKAGCRS